MAPKRVDKSQKKRVIAQAALDILVENGFDGLSISRVAETANISKGAVYLYFNSKEALIAAAAAAWVETIEAQASWAVVEAADPLDRLRNLFRVSTRAFIDNPKVIGLFLGIAQVAVRDPALLERLDLSRKTSAPIREAVVTILMDGVACGALRPEVAENAERFAINLVAFVDGIGLHYVTAPGFFDLNEQIDLYLEGLLRTLRAPYRDEEASIDD